jgi:hypothetical protein
LLRKGHGKELSAGVWHAGCTPMHAVVAESVGSA